MKLEPATGQILKLCIIGLGIAVITFFLLQSMGFFNSLNDLLLDLFILHSDGRQPDQRVLVIEIDDESVRQLGKPIPRSSYVKLLRKLPALGAKTIAFDLLFIDEENQANDSLLAFVSDSMRHVVHCFNFSDKAANPNLLAGKDYQKYAIAIEDQTNLKVMTAPGANFPHKKFINKFDQAGHITVEWDYDGRSRRMPLCYEFGDRIYPSLGVAALFDYFRVTNRSMKIENSFWGRNAVIETPAGTIQIPIDSKGQMLLNLYGVFDVLEPAPLYEMMKLVDAFQPRDPAQLSLPLFEGKLVLIGNTETGMDKYETTFSAEFPGVGFHATFLNNILRDDFIREASWRGNAAILAILTLLLLSAFIYYQKISKSIWIFYIFPVTLIVFFNIMAYLIFFKSFSIWLQLIQINGCYLVTFVAMVFYEKVIRLKELNSKISQLKNEILTKNSELEKLNQRITAQTEQYKTIEYFVKGLQTATNDPAVNPEGELKKFFPGFFSQYERMKGSLEEQIKQLNFEKERISREKEELENEKNIYQDILKGSGPTKARPPQEKLKINKRKVAQQIMSAWQYFQSQQKKGILQPDPGAGIVALTTILNEKNEKVKTPMGDIIEKIKMVSSYDSTVLITGEVGVGKELVARAIHQQSSRSTKRLVTINCATLPEHLMESELFGHKKGAFTDAKYDHKGAFEYADSGTIFLDEIGELKLDLQAKLLRVLQNKEIQKVGSNEPIKVDVRVVAATNKNLKRSIDENEFRSDLYSRLHVIDLHIPPLRERKYDIPFLIQHFLDRFNSTHGREKSFSSEAVIAMMCHEWPNNVRNLEHVIEKVCVLTLEDEVPLSALPDEIQTAYRDIFESNEVPWWNQIEQLVHQEQQRLLQGCKSALKTDRIDEFLSSKHLQADHKICANCYDYLVTFVSGIASIFSMDRREALVRRTIVQMQEQLLQWCRQEKFARLSGLYDPIEKLLGRSRRQIDNWRKE